MFQGVKIKSCIVVHNFFKSIFFKKPNIYNFDLYYDILEFLENIIQKYYTYNIFQDDIDILFKESQILFIKYKDEVKQ